GDTVVFSARLIPGNERPVKDLYMRLQGRGARVLTDVDVDLPIHASGHPARDELRKMYSWVKPELVVPVHGEDRHMHAAAALAAECDVPRQLVGQNGDLFMLAGQRGIRRGFAPTGRLGRDRDSLVPVTTA
ncbi:MAG: ribonuclease J, partial [Gammaproteobacteria bacterium]|nr:ribonuclease J [Gammaproteobacteria bacterium]